MITEAKFIQNVDDAVTLHIRRSGMTQAEFASKMPLSELQFSKKRKGIVDWKVSECITLCKIIGCDVGDLFKE